MFTFFYLTILLKYGKIEKIKMHCLAIQPNSRTHERKVVNNMSAGIWIGAAAVAVVALGAAGSYAGAKTLFNKVIPRKDGVRVNMDEMADAQKWEEYRKIITPNREWLQGQNPEEITIKARDGIKLHAYFLPAQNPTGKLVIGLHGYSSTGISEFSTSARFYHEQGFDVLIPDHRAHGQSEGDYVGFGILDRFDCLCWIDYLEKRFPEGRQILLHGTSMGGSTALMVTGFKDLSPSVKGVVADCAFTSPYDVFAHILKRDYHMSEFPVMKINSAMCRKKAGYGFEDYSTLTALQTNTLPCLFIHGAEDDFVPVWMSDKNYEACKAPKKLLKIEGAAHGASTYQDKETYQAALKEFIDTYMK